MKKWTQKEIDFLKENYKKTLHKELIRILNRDKGSIDYMAAKLGLKKDYNFYCKSRKKLKKEFTKEIFENLYHKQNNSIREIASKLGIGKNTVSYYFNKYKIPFRGHSEANKLRALKYPNWREGLTKDSDLRIRLAAEKARRTFNKKRKERLRKIEEKFGKSIKGLINDFYWKEGFNQEKIGERLGLPRDLIIKLMKKLEVSKRLNFEYIASLKGINHPMYGKKWEEVHGIEGAKKRKKEFSLRAQRNIIKRLENHEMPFMQTKIEKKIAKEMEKKGIIFCSQYSVDKKMVCDFAIPEFDIIIECDGDYWHANPKLYKHQKLDYCQRLKVQRDAFKNKYLKEKGWRVFRFFESDINKSPEKCINEVINEIKEELKKIPSPLDSLMNKEKENKGEQNT